MVKYCLVRQEDDGPLLPRVLRTSNEIGGHRMNATEIIKSIEQEQLKPQVDEFRVGDTVRVYGKIKE